MELRKVIEEGNAFDFKYDGMKHKSLFSQYVKPKRQLFSTFEPVNIFESRYNAVVQNLTSTMNSNLSSPGKTNRLQKIA